MMNLSSLSKALGAFAVAALLSVVVLIIEFQPALSWLLPYLSAGSHDDAEEIRHYPVRVSDIDLFDHMNNSVYWSVIEDYLYSHPDLLAAPLRVTIEHDAPVALGDKLEILSHVYRPGSTDKFGAELSDRTVTTLTYAVGDETKAVAALFAL